MSYAALIAKAQFTILIRLNWKEKRGKRKKNVKNKKKRWKDRWTETERADSKRETDRYTNRPRRETFENTLRIR